MQSNKKDSETMEEYMLHVHEASTVIRCAYLDWIPDQGKNLMRDGFYHGLTPSLCNVLTFAIAELLEHEQVNTSFDMLYTLAKKLEVRQPHKGGQGSSEAHRDRFRRYPTGCHSEGGGIVSTRSRNSRLPTTRV